MTEKLRQEARASGSSTAPPELLREKSTLSVKELQRQVLAQGKALAELEHSIASLAEAIRPDDGEAELEVPTDISYQDSWPACEITVVMIEVLKFDLVGMTFDAEFVIHLDWLDPRLRRGIHYEFNAERGKFEFMQALCTCKNDMYFFNPKIFIQNSKVELDEVEHFPEILDEVPDEVENVEIPWLHKEFHFLGTLTCRNVSARMFPFDIETLHIKITAHDMHGTTSVGQARRLRFAEPFLRTEWRLRKKKSGHPIAGYAVSRQPDAIMSHMWALDDDGGETLTIGEMRVIGIGGAIENDDADMYDFAMVLKRRWYPRYFFDILIYNLQTLTALISVFCPFDLDQLTNRMSITLTVLLTVVGVSSIRPPVIADLPYHTLHDWYGQIMVFSVLIVGVGNLVVFTNCWGMFRKQGFGSDPDTDDYYDTATSMVVNRYQGTFPGKWWCEQNDSIIPCFDTSRMDCLILWFTIITLALLATYVFLSSQLYRITTILRVKHHLDVRGAARSFYSKLVLCDLEGFDLFDKYEIMVFGRVVALAPFFTWFWRGWYCLRGLRRQCCPCCRDQRDTEADEPESLMHLAHPLDSAPQLSEAIDYLLRREEMLPNISKFHFKISPWDTFRVLDVGSGEMGFYSYSLDGATNHIKTTGSEGKLKYRKGMTFVDHFLHADEGPGELAQNIIERFSLQLAPAHSAALPSVICPETDAEGEAVKSTSVTRKSDGARQDKDMSPPKQKLLMCLTGANRQMLRDSEEGREKLNAFLAQVNQNLQPYLLEVTIYSPEDVDEAMYELWATEWVVQRGDLNVTDVHLSRAFRTLNRGIEEGQTNWKEVAETYGDLNAEPELKDAFRNAAGVEYSKDELPEHVFCGAFYASFEASLPLLRALVRARLFSGTLSAGSGSSQVTFRVAGSLATSQVHSLPMGNRTPMVSMMIGGTADTVSILSKKLPRTREIAMELLCEADMSASKPRANAVAPAFHKGTRPAWDEDGPVHPDKLELWRRLFVTCAEERELPSGSRGLFVGISAVFYAAKSAGCAEVILKRDDFLAKLRAKIDDLMAKGGTAGRDLANLMLVSSMVEYILHRTALIVCKRNWKVQEGVGKVSDFVATWTLGMYLKHSGVLAIPVRTA